MSSRSTKPTRCSLHNKSTPCSKCRHEADILRHTGAGMTAIRTAGIESSSFDRENAFRPSTNHTNQTTSSRSQQLNRSTHSIVRQPIRSVVCSSQPTHVSGASSSVAATRADSPKARGPPPTTTIQKISIPGSGHGTNTTHRNNNNNANNSNNRTMTQQQHAGYGRAPLAQREGSAARHEQPEEEDESSSEEDSDDEDDEEDEDEDDE